MFSRVVSSSAAFILCACVVGACSSAETSVTSPSDAGDRCSVSVSNTQSAFTSAGGSGALNVSTARDCTWTVATSTAWVNITGARTGQGSASVAYNVAANPVPASRSGSIAVASETVPVTQAAAPCQYSLSRSSDAIAAAGGRLGFDVSTVGGCSWTASSSDGWIALSSGQSGNGSGSVGLTVSPNAGNQRVGRVNVAGQSYTVTQEATPPPAAPAPAPGPTPAPTPAPSPQPPSGPTPSPTPTPAPTPAPKPPPAPKAVQLEGTAFVLSRSCPNATFFVDGERVVADGSTDYRKGDCSDLGTGDELKVEGLKSDDFVRATRIEFKKTKHD
jgi:hypothetical protein